MTMYLLSRRLMPSSGLPCVCYLEYSASAVTTAGAGMFLRVVDGHSGMSSPTFGKMPTVKPASNEANVSSVIQLTPDAVLGLTPQSLDWFLMAH